MSTVKQTTERLAAIFDENRHVLCAYLFGSEARERASEHSDVDIAVLFDETVDPKDYMDKSIDITTAASKTLSREVDVVVLNRAATYLAFQILRKGKKIFERRENIDRRFEARAIQEYFDYLPVRTMMEKKMLAKIKERSHGG